MGSRIDELEKSINDLRAEMDVEGSPSPLPPEKAKSEEPKPAEGSTWDYINGVEEAEMVSSINWKRPTELSFCILIHCFVWSSRYEN